MRSARLLVAALLAPAMLGGAGSVLALAATVLGPAVRADATTKPCVGVIVDGRLAGGTVQTGCATGDPRSGLEALTDAGISYAFVPRVPGQVCQLDGLPECARNSADTYWSYWWRAKGSSRWVYATSGAGSHEPKPGDTEGWVWQEGGRREPPDIAFRTVCPQATSPGTPTSSPPTRRASASTGAAPTASATSRARNHPKPATDSAAPATSATPSRSATSSGAATTTAPATITAAAPSSGAATTSEGSSPGSTPVTAAPAAAQDSSGSGPPWVGLAAGGLLVALLGGAALARSRRNGPSP